MRQSKIWLAFLLVLTVGITLSARIVYLGDSVQAVNHSFIAEKLPLSQRIGELRGVIANQEHLLYEYYSYTATRDAFLIQQAENKKQLLDIVSKLEADTSTRAVITQLRTQLMSFWQSSVQLSNTLAVSEQVRDWDKARDILAQIKPQVRQIENTLAVINSANQQAVNTLGKDSQDSVQLWSAR